MRRHADPVGFPEVLQRLDGQAIHDSYGSSGTNVGDRAGLSGELSIRVTRTGGFWVRGCEANRAEGT